MMRERNVAGTTRSEHLRVGRGAGYLATARAGADASEDLLVCVLHDPRWDRQVESREDYYARLMIATSTDVTALRRRIVDSDRPNHADLWLPIGVLAAMCRRGSEVARDAIADAVRRGGAQWRACLDALEGAGGRELIREVLAPEDVDALVGHVGVDELADAMTVVRAPWDEWATRVPALRFVAQASARPEVATSRPVAWIASRMRGPEIPEQLATLSSAALLALASIPGARRVLSVELARRPDAETRRLLISAATSGSPDERHVALRALGLMGRVDFLDAAEAHLRRESTEPTERRGHHRRVAFLRYLEALPAESTLPLARRWLFEPRPLSLAAELVLARHATPEDRSSLEQAGRAALEASDMVRLSSMVEAIGVAGPDASVPFLIEAYERVPYSYARCRVVNAMSRCERFEGVERHLEESLWDCESESRQIACESVDESKPRVRGMLEEIAGDTFEEEVVREAAEVALASRRG